MVTGIVCYTRSQCIYDIDGGKRFLLHLYGSRVKFLRLTPAIRVETHVTYVFAIWPEHVGIDILYSCSLIYRPRRLPVMMKVAISVEY